MVATAERLLESCDVARLVGLTPAGVRFAVEAGHISPVALTERGVRLFRRVDVEEWRERRAASAAARRHFGSRG